MAFLFSGLYEPIPDIDLYLERIDYHGDRSPTLANLGKFMENGSAYIVKDHLTISSGDKVEERKLETEDKLRTVLWEVFGIRANTPI